MSDATLDALAAMNKRLMAILEVLPTAGEGMHVGDLEAALAKRGIDLQGIKLTDALRYIESHGLIVAGQNRTRWRKVR